MKLRSLVACLLPLTIVAASTVGCAAQANEDEDEDEDVGVADQAIVGGVEAQPGAWAGTVALYKGGSQACGGTLVADEWVVTAAHCVTTSSPTGGFTKVVINRHRLSTSGGESLTVKRAFRHARFSSSTLDNDIALIQLSTKSRSPIGKILSADQTAAVAAPTSVTTVGWGTTSQGGSSSDVLRQVSVPIIANTTCKSFSSYSRVTENMICAGLTQGGMDSCQGDSGGPLFMKFGAEIRLVGLVSWGIGCARPRAPGVYTRLSNYLTWMRDQSGGAIGGAAVSDAGAAVDSGAL